MPEIAISQGPNGVDVSTDTNREGISADIDLADDGDGVFNVDEGMAQQ